MVRKRRRCDDTRRDASLRRAAIRELVVFARIINLIKSACPFIPRVRHNIKRSDITDPQHLLTMPNCLSQRYLP